MSILKMRAPSKLVRKRKDGTVSKRRKRLELGEYWLYKAYNCTPNELARMLQDAGLLAESFGSSDLTAYWTKDNAIKVFFKGTQLPGIIRFERKTI